MYLLLRNRHNKSAVCYFFYYTASCATLIFFLSLSVFSKALLQIYTFSPWRSSGLAQFRTQFPANHMRRACKKCENEIEFVQYMHHWATQSLAFFSKVFSGLPMMIIRIKYFQINVYVFLRRSRITW